MIKNTIVVFPQKNSACHFVLSSEDEPTPAELALEAGRAYVLLPQKRWVDETDKMLKK